MMRSGSILLRISWALMLTLLPAAWAQQVEQAPLSLTGDLGAGYSSEQYQNLSASSGIVSGDADLTGYWRDPRILFFEFTPFGSSGNSVASGIDLANRGNGFTGTATVLGGSFFPVQITYSRLWQQFPGTGSTSNLLGG